MIVVGYLATREGRQGVTSALEEAVRRKVAVTVVVSEKSAKQTPEALSQRDEDLAQINAEAQQREVSLDLL